MQTYVGIDPGAKGAIALIHGEELRLWRAPMALVKRGKSKKPTTDFEALAPLVRMLADMQPVRVAVEKVWGVAGQGASTGAALGHARCAFEACFFMVGVRVNLVPPQTWKADLGLYGLPKEAAIDKACELFPSYAAEFRPVRGERDKELCIGRADAALIAWHTACTP